MNKIILTLFISVFFGFCYSQQIIRSHIGSKGYSFSSDKLTIQSTLGQMATKTLRNNQSILRQGFNQPNQNIDRVQEMGIIIYPNPNNGIFSIYFEQDHEQPYSYIIYDQLGNAVVDESNVFGLTREIDISQHCEGLYYLFIKTHQFQKTLKLILTK